jgi:hypothetical protein
MVILVLLPGNTVPKRERAAERRARDEDRRQDRRLYGQMPRPAEPAGEASAPVISCAEKALLSIGCAPG